MVPVHEKFVCDRDLFDRYVAEWKREIQSGMAPFERSLTMMKRGLALLKNGVSSELVAEEVQRITSNLIDQGLVWREAINFLKDRVRGGAAAVFSTTNYRQGAVGFLLALHLKGWIRQTELKKIFVSGSKLIGALGLLFISIWVATKLLGWWTPWESAKRH